MHSTLLLALLAGHLSPIFALPTPPLPTLPGPLLDKIHTENPTNPIDEAGLSSAIKNLAAPVTGGSSINARRQHGEEGEGPLGLPLHIGTPAGTGESSMIDSIHAAEQDADANGWKPQVLPLRKEKREEKRKRQLELVQDPGSLVQLGKTALTLAKGVAPSKLVPRQTSSGDESVLSDSSEDGESASTDTDSDSDSLGDVIALAEDNLTGDDDHLAGLGRRDLASAVLKIVPPNALLAEAGKVSGTGLKATGLKSEDINGVALAEGQGLRDALVPRGDGGLGGVGDSGFTSLLKGLLGEA